jgi:hypothetical protein
MLVAVGSTKGSPGATMFALALAARWPGESVLVEADPDGGDLGARCAIPDDPGIASLVLAARRGDAELADHTQRIGVGIDVLVAPAGAARSAATVEALPPAALVHTGLDVLVDVGRLGGDSPAAGIVATADRIIVVCRGDLASVDHTAAYTRAVPQPGRVGVVVVGACPYPMAELADVFGVPVQVQAPIDHRAVAVLTGARRAHRGWHRVGLAAAARTVAIDLRPLAASTGHQPPTPDTDLTRPRGGGHDAEITP